MNIVTKWVEIFIYNGESYSRITYKNLQEKRKIENFHGKRYNIPSDVELKAKYLLTLSLVGAIKKAESSFDRTTQVKYSKIDVFNALYFRLLH